MSLREALGMGMGGLGALYPDGQMNVAATQHSFKERVNYAIQQAEERIQQTEQRLAALKEMREIVAKHPDIDHLLALAKMYL